MSDWDEFRRDVSWFPPPSASVDVGPVAPATEVLNLTRADFLEVFPTLAALLSRANLTPIKVHPRRKAGQDYHLLSWWCVRGSRFGWLCPVPTAGDTPQIFGSHALLLRTFGGMGERFNEPEDTWLFNLYEALTATAAARPTERLWVESGNDAGPRKHRGERVTIELDRLYPIAVEANGNTTLCDRTTGDVTLYAHDHSFTHVQPLDGWPEYTFYRIPEAPTFRDWVEAVARQWSRHVRAVASA